jgi:diacylglycerol kinase family enzyme
LPDCLERLDAHPNRVLIAVNPRAGARHAREQIAHLADALRRDQFHVEIESDGRRLQQMAFAALAEGSLRAIVAAGGDGTVAEVVNRCPPRAPLAILPLGTENLLAKYLGQTACPSAVAKTIASGRIGRFDAGLAGGRIFTLMISAGVDAEVIRRLHECRSGNITHLAYLKPIWDSFRSYTYPELRIYCRQRDPRPASSISARWMIGVNLPQYARGLKFAPSADGTDGLLDICAFRQGSLASNLRYLVGVAAGWHEGWRDCSRGRCTRMRIEADGPVPFQLDGDLGGWLPVEVEVLPRRLRLLAPPTFAGALAREADNVGASGRG